MRGKLVERLNAVGVVSVLEVLLPGDEVAENVPLLEQASQANRETQVTTEQLKLIAFMWGI